MSIALEAGPASALAGRRPLATSLVYGFFFVSGMPALIYQLVWQRVLFRIFGVSMDSVTVVVAAFMLGLGVGSLLGSWLTMQKRLRPLLVVAAMECAIGVFGVCSLALFAQVDPLVQDLNLTLRAFVVMALVFVPTLLMGATLPVLVGHFVRRTANVGMSMGSLYRANALGAVMGCAVAALVLFPFTGLQAAAFAAAGLNLLVAAIAVAGHFADAAEHGTATARARAPAFVPPMGFKPALAIVCLSGFVSLSFEIYLLHIASFESGTGELALSLTLGAFILGIAAGAQDVAEWCKTNAPGKPLPGSMVGRLLMHGVAGLALLPLLTHAAFIGEGLIGIIALAAFLIARSLGGVFSLIGHFVVPPDGNAGKRAGFLYLANIAGSAAGSLITGFYLTEFVGMRALAVLLSGAGLAVTVFFIWRFNGRTGRPALRVMIPMLAIAALLAACQYPLTRTIMESLLFKTANAAPLSRVVENRNGIVVVDQDDVVYGGGIYDGRFNVSLTNDTNGAIRPFALSLFHPAMHDVFMIGLASGSWAQIIASNPDVRHLTVVEINPGYLPLIAERPEVRSIMHNPKIEIVIDDAHRWLKRHPDRKFDAIIANATYHFRANASNLLSVEFDRLIAEHLARGGFYLYNPTQSPRAQRTGCAGFRHGYRLFNFMLVANDPIAVDPQHWRGVLTAYRIDGRPVFDSARKSDAALLARVLTLAPYATTPRQPAADQPIETCASVLGRTTAQRLITDDNMGTEWRYPLGLDRH
ncbi:MAG TPA: fused MFS/spermidine synthase [Rhizomicrobium sp.]|nr:fused MFS/spermidine synthase [Rhizomicrobium sp.]